MEVLVAVPSFFGFSLFSTLVDHTQDHQMHPPKHGSCPTDLEDSDLLFCFNSFGTIRIDRKVYQAHQIVQCLAKSITVRSGCGIIQ